MPLANPWSHPTGGRHTDLSVHSQADLDAVAADINNRPRKRLGYLTPLEVFNKLALQ
jgi:IS30 family transposase